MKTNTIDEIRDGARLGLLRPDLRHLLTMTDDTGILQHAKYGVPDRSHGYCSDDNARALMVAAKQYALFGDESVLPLAGTYLAFLDHAFDQEEKRFRNFMTYDRRWREESGSEDSHGRSVWALGIATRYLPRAQGPLAMELFEMASRSVEGFSSPRAWAFTLLGIDHYLSVFPGAEEPHRLRAVLAEKIFDCFAHNATDGWYWCEERVTYSNAKIPLALIVAGRGLGKKDLTETGLRSLRWLLDLQTSEKGCISLVGNDGWCEKDGEHACFDQQPVDAMGLVLCAIEAYRTTGREEWMHEAERVFRWFLGDNDLGVPLYDSATGGCRDGLQRDGVNLNLGAESTLAWLISLLAMHEIEREDASVPAEAEAEV